MRRDQPIIIGGFYRCGTTLLRRLLDAHSRIHCPPEIKFFRDLFLDFHQDPYAHLRFFTTVRSLPASSEDLLDTLGKGYVQLRHLVMLRQGKDIWADKDPENALYLDSWQRLLPDGFRYLHVTRHPLDMLASIREAAFVKTLPDDPAAILLRWQANCAAAQAFQEQHRERVRVLHYEELVRAPQEVLTALFAWLGLAMEPEVLAGFADPARGCGIEDQKVSATGTIHQASVGRSLADFPVALAERLLAPCRAELDWLGYPLVPERTAMPVCRGMV